MTVVWSALIIGNLVGVAPLSPAVTAPPDIVRDHAGRVDLGLGAPLAFGRAEDQASHKIRGTALDETGTSQAIELE